MGRWLIDECIRLLLRWQWVCNNLKLWCSMTSFLNQAQNIVMVWVCSPHRTARYLRLTGHIVSRRRLRYHKEPSNRWWSVTTIVQQNPHEIDQIFAWTSGLKCCMYDGNNFGCSELETLGRPAKKWWRPLVDIWLGYASHSIWIIEGWTVLLPFPGDVTFEPRLQYPIIPHSWKALAHRSHWLLGAKIWQVFRTAHTKELR